MKDRLKRVPIFGWAWITGVALFAVGLVSGNNNVMGFGILIVLGVFVWAMLQ